MSRNTKKGHIKIKQSLFPVSLYFALLIDLLLMSGVHYGLLVLMNEQQWSDWVQVTIPIVYWILVALGLTL